MPLHIDYRPSSFDEVIGNQGVVESHKAIFQRESDFPHAVLYQGPSGCGKTTMARIYAKTLGCSDNDLIEINVANNRGIDTARKIQSEMRFQPFGGPVRVYIIDECFAKFTKIKTPNGDINIQDIKPGDKVYNIDGISDVKRVFKNKVILDRVVKVELSNGENIYCSEDHLFLTEDNKWIEAKNLSKKDFILKFSWDMMDTINKRKDSINGQKKMFTMWESFFNKEQKLQFLFLHLFQQIKNKVSNCNLWFLWQRIRDQEKGEIYKKILQSQLCVKIRSNITSYYSNTKIEGKSFKNSGINKNFQIKKSRKVDENRFGRINPDDKQQSIFKPQDCRKRQGNKENKWNFAHLACDTWRKWTVYRASKTFIPCLGMANGSGNQNELYQGQRWISNLLQGGYRARKIKNSYRDRWSESQIEKDYIFRYKKGEKTKRVRVESVKVYKRDCDQQFFRSVIGDKERNQGFVEFYDLEINGHPSYFVNNVLVHNCHQSTKDFQNAMLKALEDSPSHVYFLLCTTDPQQLLPTIKNRCTTFEMSSLSSAELKMLLNHVLKHEEVDDIPQDIIEEIVEISDGCPRQALVTLDKIIDLPLESMSKAIQDMRMSEASIRDLCQVILKKRPWKEVSSVLKAIDMANPENIRRAILGYMTTVLLNEDNAQAALAIEFFKEPTYNSGKAGLVYAAYNSVFD